MWRKLFHTQKLFSSTKCTKFLSIKLAENPPNWWDLLKLVMPNCFLRTYKLINIVYRLKPLACYCSHYKCKYSNTTFYRLDFPVTGKMVKYWFLTRKILARCLFLCSLLCLQGFKNINCISCRKGKLTQKGGSPEYNAKQHLGWDSSSGAQGVLNIPLLQLL